jgi:hypothetical protein
MMLLMKLLLVVSTTSTAAAVGQVAPPFASLAYRAVPTRARNNIALLPVVGADNITWQRNTTTGRWVAPDLDGTVARLVAATNAMPTGLRAIRAWDLYRNETNHPADNIMDAAGVQACAGRMNPPGAFVHPGGAHSWSIWWDAGVAETLAAHQRFIRAFKAAGGELDVWVVDDEQGGMMHSWHIATSGSDACGIAKYSAIERDRRWPAMLAQLQAAGFGFPTPPLAPVGLADFMMRAVNGTHDLNQRRFTAWMATVSRMYYRSILQGQAAPIMAAFPGARFAEYDAVLSSPSHCVPNSNGILFCSALPLSGALEPGIRATRAEESAAVRPLFNSQNSAMYMDIAAGFGATLVRDFGVRSYPLTPFNAARAMVNRLMAGVLVANDNSACEPMAYLAWKHYGTTSTDNMASDAYQEMIFHAGLGGVAKFLMWNTHAVAGDNDVLSASLAEMSLVVGAEGWTWRHPAAAAAAAAAASSTLRPAVASEVVHDWNDGFILTGASTGTGSGSSSSSSSSGDSGHGHRCVYRFSPDLTSTPIPHGGGGGGGQERLSMLRRRYLSMTNESDGSVTITIRVNATTVKLRNAAVWSPPPATAAATAVVPASVDGLWIVQHEQGPGQAHTCVAERKQTRASHR